jgi:hypothetical protein
MTFTNTAIAAPPVPPVPIVNDGAWFSPADAGQIDHDKQELELIRQQVKVLVDANNNLTKQNELLQKEVDLNKQLADIAEKKAEASDKAFQQMKEISDKWQELAKVTNKPKVAWTQILGGVIAGIIAGAWIASIL